MNRAIFLDRDGVINEEVGYISKVSQFKFIPGVAQALSELRDMGYLLIVVTNQSGIARNLYTIEDLEDIHHYMMDELEKEDVFLDAIYYAPFHPGPLENGNPKFIQDHIWRKPKPGMLLQAAEDFDIDLEESIMIGDSERDLVAGNTAGCKCVWAQGKNTESPKVNFDYRIVKSLAELPSLLQSA